MKADRKRSQQNTIGGHENDIIGNRHETVFEQF